MAATKKKLNADDIQTDAEQGIGDGESQPQPEAKSSQDVSKQAIAAPASGFIKVDDPNPVSKIASPTNAEMDAYRQQLLNKKNGIDLSNQASYSQSDTQSAPKQVQAIAQPSSKDYLDKSVDAWRGAAQDLQKDLSNGQYAKSAGDAVRGMAQATRTAVTTPVWAADQALRSGVNAAGSAIGATAGGINTAGAGLYDTTKNFVTGLTGIDPSTPTPVAAPSKEDLAAYSKQAIAAPIQGSSSGQTSTTSTSQAKPQITSGDDSKSQTAIPVGSVSGASGGLNDPNVMPGAGQAAVTITPELAKQAIAQAKVQPVNTAQTHAQDREVLPGTPLVQKIAQPIAQQNGQSKTLDLSFAPTFSSTPQAPQAPQFIPLRGSMTPDEWVAASAHNKQAIAMMNNQTQMASHMNQHQLGMLNYQLAANKDQRAAMNEPLDNQYKQSEIDLRKSQATRADLADRQLALREKQQAAQEEARNRQLQTNALAEIDRGYKTEAEKAAQNGQTLTKQMYYASIDPNVLSGAGVKAPTFAKPSGRDLEDLNRLYANEKNPAQKAFILDKFRTIYGQHPESYLKK